MSFIGIAGGEMTAAGNICVMGEEPVTDRTPEDIREWYFRHPGEAGLAAAYADASNEFYWVADDLDDYAKGTPEWEKTAGIVDAWGDLTRELEMVILTIQRSKGDRIPGRGYFPVLCRFMERSGYRDSWGWWVPKPKET